MPRLNTVFDVLEAVYMIDRVGRKPTTKSVGKLAGSSFYRTQRMLSDAEGTGLVGCHHRQYRQNSVAKVWLLTIPGKAIVKAYQEGCRAKGWVLGSPQDYVGEIAKLDGN